MSWKMSVLKTVRYARRFGCELSATEIRERLIGGQIVDGNLPGFKRDNDNPYLDEKMQTVRQLTEKYLARIPEVMMVGVTGSVASGYPKEDDDIDLMIITRSRSLWLTRAWVTWLLWKNGVPRRRQGRTERKNELCLNLWLEEDGLLIPNKKRNLRNAVDLILMKPVLVKGGIDYEFLKTNSWVKKYVATGYERRMRTSRAGKKKKIITDSLPAVSTPKKLLNRLAYWGQRWYMAPKMTVELVNLKMAFFHPEKKSV